MAEGGEDPPKRKRRNLLKLYYGVSENPSAAQIDPTDINSPHFQCPAYMEQLLQKSSLAELMDKEDQMLQRKNRLLRLHWFGSLDYRSRPSVYTLTKHEPFHHLTIVVYSWGVLVFWMRFVVTISGEARSKKLLMKEAWFERMLSDYRTSSLLGRRAAESSNLLQCPQPSQLR